MEAGDVLHVVAAYRGHNQLRCFFFNTRMVDSQEITNKDSYRTSFGNKVL